MERLTQLDAAYVLQEAYRLKASQIAGFGIEHARLGQSIHLAFSEHSLLGFGLKSQLRACLDYHHASALDFFYWEDDAKVVDVFFKHYVGEE